MMLVRVVWGFERMLLPAVLILLVTLPSQQARAQDRAPQDAGWSDSYPLSREGEPRQSLPRLAVDRQGRVHLLWVSPLDASDASSAAGQPSVIVYRRLDGDGWSQPNDVLATPQLGPLILGSVAIDDRDVLNLLWFDQGASRDLFLSQAYTSLAGNAQSWTTQVLERPRLAMNGPDLVAGAGGALHVVYALDQQSILYLASADYGATWSQPDLVWGVDNAQLEAVINARIAVDGKGYLHVVWTVTTADRDWNPVAIYYARSVDGGQTWDPQEIHRSLAQEPTAGWIGVAIRGENEIHLAWNRGVGSQEGRFHMWSPDNGGTWSPPRTFLPDFVSGQTQWPLMAVDSAGTLHLVTVAGGPPPVEGDGDFTRPRYTSWDGAGWSPMVTFSESTSDLNVAFAIGLSNQLHLVHETGRFQGRLLYNTVIVDAPAEPTRTISDPAPTAPPALPQPSSTPWPSPTPVGSAPAVYAPPSLPGASPLGSLILPLVPVVLILAAVLAWSLHRRGRTR